MSRRVHNVSPTEPGCHRRISDALAKAESGEIINVLPGEYEERLYLSVPVTITARDGRGSVVVMPSSGGCGILMATETATLSGLVLNHRDDERASVDVISPAGAVADVKIDRLALVKVRRTLRVTERDRTECEDRRDADQSRDTHVVPPPPNQLPRIRPRASQPGKRLNPNPDYTSHCHQVVLKERKG